MTIKGNVIIIIGDIKIYVSIFFNNFIVLLPNNIHFVTFLSNTLITIYL